MLKSKPRILLMDFDISTRRRLFPNLALMKLSAYHKAKGDIVRLNFLLDSPDIIYASCVFTWNTRGRNQLPSSAILGGSGFDLTKELSPEVEHIMPDYALYPKHPWIDYSIGFTSRGCIRKCTWCIVPKKEGRIKASGRIYEFWNHQHKKIMLLDNNLLASPNWQQTMEDILAEGLVADFNQGLDIRLVNEENVSYLKRVKTKELRFAFDNIIYESAVRKGIELLLANGIKSRHLSFYLLHGFSNDDAILERVNILQSYNVELYPMAYKDTDGKEPTRRILEVADIPFLHGARRNINKFLRLVGRLP